MSTPPMKTLITGGAGFVGTNVADRLLEAGDEVTILDSFTRPGTRANLEWLLGQHPGKLEVHEADVRDRDRVRRAMYDVDRVFHFAAQVAVTSSVDDPTLDFDVNLRGSLNVLECARRMDQPPRVLFTSTNKVYGRLDDVPVARTPHRGGYEPIDPTLRGRGIDETRPLSFCSPYGCSKGGADQYVLDYAESYGLETVVLRMSCVYGRHQLGNEDQGWVAHFARQVLEGRPITLYGDGYQVRDILCVDDLVGAMLLAIDGRAGFGSAFNIGGGPDHRVSLHSLLELVGELCDRAPEIRYGDWRVGDQRWFVTDYGRFEKLTGWRPAVTVSAGVQQLVDWLTSEEASSRGAMVARAR